MTDLTLPTPGQYPWGEDLNAAMQRALDAAEIVDDLAGARDEAVDARDDAVAARDTAVAAAGGVTSLSRIVNASRTQARRYGDFLRKLRNGDAIRIACYGGSHTYGQDTNSADKVAADPTPTPSGASHTFTRSPKPWPSVLQDRLNDAYLSTCTVVNRGFSGDHVALGFQHWTTSANADASLFMYGVNDANFVNDMAAFVDGYETLLLREIVDYGAAAILVTPCKLRYDAGGQARIEAYRQAVYGIGQRLGIPVIDGEELLAGYDNRTHSDSIHLNTFGNNVFGSRIAAALIGDGAHNPRRVVHGSKFLARATIDPITLGLNTATEYSGVGTPSEGNDGTAGVRVRLGGGQTTGRATYAFRTEQPDLVAIPQLSIDPSVAVRVQLDYGIEQPDNFMDWLIAGETPGLTGRAAAELQQTSGGTQIDWLGHSNLTRGIRIASPGWHSLRCSGGASASSGAGRLYGVEFLDYATWRTMVAAGF